MNPSQVLAESFSDFLGEYGRRMSGLPYGEMSHCFSHRAELNCNWKIALDAFSEAYQRRRDASARFSRSVFRQYQPAVRSAGSASVQVSPLLHRLPES
jgi:hypothetical protein